MRKQASSPAAWDGCKRPCLLSCPSPLHPSRRMEPLAATEAAASAFRLAVQSPSAASVCSAVRWMMEGKPPAGPPGVPSRGLQPPLSPRAPGGGSVWCAPPLPGFPADRKGSAGPSRDCPARIRSAWDSPPAGAALMRSGRLIGVRSLPPPDHSVQGGSGRRPQATVAAFPFPHPPPHPSFVKRLPVAGSRRVLAPVMPPALRTAGVPPAAPPRPYLKRPPLRLDCFSTD